MYELFKYCKKFNTRISMIQIFGSFVYRCMYKFRHYLSMRILYEQKVTHTYNCTFLIKASLHALTILYVIFHNQKKKIFANYYNNH